jgi:hypothetical protein
LPKFLPNRWQKKHRFIQAKPSRLLLEWQHGVLGKPPVGLHGPMGIRVSVSGERESIYDRRRNDLPKIDD